MATSGTYAFSMSRDQIIASALRTMEVIGAGQTPSAADITNCAEALNIMSKATGAKFLPLWCIQEITIPLVTNQASYALNPRPLRILQAYIRNQTGMDTELNVISRFEYNTQSMKMSPAQPNQIYFDANLVAPTVTVYDVPADTSNTLHLVLQRQVQDFNLSTDNPDFPPEAYLVLKWKLIDELGLEYGAKPHVLQMAAAKAKTFADEFEDLNQEQVSQFFVPSGRTQ